MHVTGYETYAVPPRWLFLKLSTSDGTVGWGEPIIEGRTRTVRTTVGELVEDYLIGEDPTEIERLWQRMYRGGHIRGGPVLMSALAGIDQALWDIKGKQLGAPVHDLLGGRARDQIRVYTWINGRGPTNSRRTPGGPATPATRRSRCPSAPPTSRDTGNSSRSAASGWRLSGGQRRIRSGE